MFCPECGTENPPKAKFCYECGIRLSEVIKSAEKISENLEDNLDYSEPDSTYHVVTTESEKESESSNNNCIICKAGEMISTVHRGSLGFGIKITLECNNCGAEFKKKGQKYNLSNISDINQPISIKYQHQTLSEDEWIRIGGGGVSDAEQQKINAQKMEAEKREIQLQKENDINQGSLILTNKRLIFIGSKRTTNIDLRKILAIEAYKDGIESQRENKQKTEYFTGTDKLSITFTINGRQTTIPILGVVLKAAIQGAIAQID